MINLYNIISWLKYLDVNYLDDETCEVLSKFNINDPFDQEKVIKLAIFPEFILLNETSKEALKKTLTEIEKYSDTELEEVTALVGMPFSEKLIDYRAFFQKVKKIIFAGEN